MAIAIMFETTNADLAEAGEWRQLLIIPDPSGEPLIFSRTTNGGKSPAYKWRKDAPGFDTVEVMRSPAAGVVMSEKDWTDMRESGFAPVLGQKGQKAVARAIEQGFPVDERHPSAFLALIVAIVAEQGLRAATYVRDGRRKDLSGLVGGMPSQAAPTAPVPAQKRPTVEQVQDDMPAPVVAPVVAATAAPAMRLATVPPKALATRYVSRTVEGVKDFAVLDYALKRRRNVLLMGPTGSGKTTLPIAWSAKNGRPCYSVSGNQSVEPSQLFGKYTSDGVGGWVWVDGPVTEIIRHGGTLILDEVNFISPKIATVLFSLLDSRREITLLDHHGEVIVGHPDILVIATGNPRYRGTNMLNEAFVNRFAVQLEWGYDETVERKLVKSKSLREMVQQIRKASAMTGIETPIGTNRMVEFEEMVTDVGWDFARMTFLARFEEGTERSSIESTMNTYAANIQAELAAPEPAAAPEPTQVEEVKERKPSPWANL